MRYLSIAAALVVVSLSADLIEPVAEFIAPYEQAEPATETKLDTLIGVRLDELGLAMAPTCSDAVFVRRVFLDITGMLPPPETAIDFVADSAPNKRARLIDRLLASEEHAIYWTMKWCDLLRVKSEFPSNLWPNAVQAYHRWIFESVRDNVSYDRFARALLTSSGSNFRVPPVNFYRAASSHEASALASVVGLTFMGVRFEGWPEERRRQFEAFFSRVAFKPTAEWKEEIVHNDPSVFAPMALTTPDGKHIQIPAGADPRVAFADWLIQPGNAWFTRNAVNREWAWLMGRGLIHEPDDLRPDHSPWSEPVLAHLEDAFIQSGCDLRALRRLILNSRAYQQSAIPRAKPEQSMANFACYRVHRLEAEVLIDALCHVSGVEEQYFSMIPEPFTYIPGAERTVALADGSTTSSFLELFGRSPRDTGLFLERNNAPTDRQCLHLLNSTHIQEKIRETARLMSRGRNAEQTVDWIYLTLLAREPTGDERNLALAYAKTPGINRGQAAEDLVWALINSMEFLYNH